jgi:hypothetical protein
MATSFIDPVAQTFFVDAATYPKGMFVHSVDLVFKKKDQVTYQPFTVQLRPVINGYPHSSLIHSSAALGQVSLRPDKINVVTGSGTNIPNLSNPNHYTRFKFPAPIFLLPGEHAIVMFTNSDNYEVFIAEVGGTRLDGSDRRVDKQVYTGSFFKSQNGSTYTAYQDIDLMFRLNACDFTPNSTTEVVFENISPTSNIEFDLMKVGTQELLFDGASTNYSYRLRDNSSGVLDTEYTSFLQDENLVLDTRKVVYTSGNSVFIKAGLVTSDNTVSPMIDSTRVNLIGVKNVINDCGLALNKFTIVDAGRNQTGNATLYVSNSTASYSDVYPGSGFVGKAVANTTSGKIERIEITTEGSGYVGNTNIFLSYDAGGPQSTSENRAVISCESEISPTGGPAAARYITRRVNLADGFDANMIRVYLTAYQPSATTIEVYYRVLADEDETLFEDRPYVRMINVQQGNESILNTLKSQVETDFIEYLFKPSTLDCSYLGTDGVTYNNFKTFSIKIVMRSSDTNYVPIIKDFRAIALAP